MVQKRWVVRQKGDIEIIKNLSKELNINNFLANLLVQRKIYNYDEAFAFFRPDLKNLYDPFLMKDMEKAVGRIIIAIENKEKILIYGDYDVDGTTAVSVVYLFLKTIYDNIDFYIPDRYSEGYGISLKSIDFAASENFSLIVALDCGIKAHLQSDYACSKNIDLIVCDHHRPDNTLPNAYAILDPKRNDCEYPYKELSGCGIGFKLIQALAIKLKIPFENITHYLDLVVLSIASDVVPITGENRILASFGLKQLNISPRPGIEAILKSSGIVRQPGNHNNGKKYSFTKELTISDLVFFIGPRVNAAGRIESGRNSVELLVSQSREKADEMAGKIDVCNNERKSLDNTAFEQAKEIIESDLKYQSRKSLVIHNPEWHKGIVGIVASRMVEYFYKPSIVLTSSNGLITGSARSIRDFDVYEAIDSCNDLLEHFGGHKFAAGLSIKEENLEAFIERFENYVSQNVSDDMLVPEIEIDDVINLIDINEGFFKILKQFAPFGPENMSPIFLTENVVDAGFSKIVAEKHLKLSIIQPDKRSFPKDAIAFQQADFFAAIHKGMPFNVCFHIEENEWNGNVNLQLNIKDIRL